MIIEGAFVVRINKNDKIVNSGQQFSRNLCE